MAKEPAALGPVADSEASEEPGPSAGASLGVGLDLPLLTQQVTKWAGSKRWWPGETDQEASVAAWTHLEDGAAQAGQETWILVLRLQGSRQLVQVPLLLEPVGGEPSAPNPALVGMQGQTAIMDAVGSPSFWKAWAGSAQFPAGSELGPESLLVAASEADPLSVEQSNSSVLLMGGDKPMIAKVFRVLHPGAHPEAEIPAALAGWGSLPTLQAVFETPIPSEKEAVCGAVLTDLVPGARDGFVLLREMANKGQDGTDLATAAGVAVAEMHNLLQERLGQGPPPKTDQLITRVKLLLEGVQNELEPADVEQIQDFMAHARAVLSEDDEGIATRVHGDLHLGQMLLDSRGTWQIVDFEGEPLRPLEERRAMDSPARDVAGMLRSFDYAGQADTTGNQEWVDTAQQAFLSGYNSRRQLSETDILRLRTYLLEKALYELQYESKFRPSWKRIPLSAIRALTR